MKVDGTVETAPICARFHSFIVIFQQWHPPRNDLYRIHKAEAMLIDIWLLQPLSCMDWYGVSIGAWMGVWIMAPQDG